MDTAKKTIIHKYLVSLNIDNQSFLKGMSDHKPECKPDFMQSSQNYSELFEKLLKSCLKTIRDIRGIE